MEESHQPPHFQKLGGERPIEQVLGKGNVRQVAAREVQMTVLQLIVEMSRESVAVEVE